MIATLQFLFALAVAAAWASHFSLEGHGFGSEPKLISQSVHLKEIPTKIIKVTKTAVVKVPVPYPVKVGTLARKRDLRKSHFPVYTSLDASSHAYRERESSNTKTIDIKS